MPQSARKPFVNTDSQPAARLPPSPGYRNVLVENSVHFVYDTTSRDEQVPTFRNDVLPSPSWFNNPVTLRSATTNLTQNTPLRIVTNLNSSHSCYSDVHELRCSLAHCHCSSERTWDLFPTVSVSLLLLQVSGYHRALHCLGMKSQPERRSGNA
jgi:hypothetical protein